MLAVTPYRCHPEFQIPPPFRAIFPTLTKSLPRFLNNVKDFPAVALKT
jgi:hypothetical protein